MVDSEIDELRSLLPKETNENSMIVDLLTAGKESFFNLPALDVVEITNILSKLKKFGWNIDLQHNQLDVLNKRISETKDRIDALLKSATEMDNVYQTLDKCIGDYRILCYDFITLSLLRQNVIIMANNYITTIEKFKSNSDNGQ